MNETERILLPPPGRMSCDRSPGRRYETRDPDAWSDLTACCAAAPENAAAPQAP